MDAATSSAAAPATEAAPTPGAPFPAVTESPYYTADYTSDYVDDLVGQDAVDVVAADESRCGIRHIDGNVDGIF